MKILSAHFLKEFYTTFFFCLLTLLFVFLVTQGFIQLADLLFNKEIDLFLLLNLLGLTLPFLLTFIIPTSVLVASLLTFGRLSHDNEIVALRAGGINLLWVIFPLLVSVVVLCLFSFILSDRVASFSHYAHRKVLTRIGVENPAAILEEGTFIKKFKNFVIFIYEIDKNKLKGIRIYQPQEGKPTRTIVAHKGEFISIPEKNVVKLKLIEGTSDEPDPNDSSKLYKLHFKTYDLPLNVSGMKGAEELGKKPKDMSVKELKDEIRRLGEEGIKATYPLAAEIHNKIALSLSALAFLLVGIPLGITTRRSEKSIGFGFGLILATAYWVLLMGGKALAQKGLTDPFCSLQFSNLVIGGMGLTLFTRIVKDS